GLIILPTRELATQVREALDPIADALGLRLATVYGGTSIDRQIKRLRSGVDIVIATPGRLTDLIDRRTCTLDDIEITVLDEADHLCDLGFYKPIDKLLSMTPVNGQRLLLSATLDGDVNRLVKKHLPKHVLHELDPADGQESTMEHHVLVTAGTDKVATAKALLGANPRTIVFTRTRRGASNLARQLTKNGIEAVDLHGDLSQRVRERNLKSFSTGQASVVVATDVAARGIHVDNVGLVVHYDAPAEHKAYLHRSGRTARAGESGAVITITTSADVGDVIRLQQKAGVKATHHDVRTAPQPMTVEALSTSGTVAPPAGASNKSGGGGKGRPGGGRRQSVPQGGYAAARNRGGARSRQGGQGGRPGERQRSYSR
ncbi:MAG: DEAD/DEAH box helicase, partial [Aeromicrobium sp.]